MCVFCIKVWGKQNVCAFYIVICGLSGCANFSELSHTWHDFLKTKKKITEHKMWFFNFPTTFVAPFLILRIIHQDILESVHMPSCWVTVVFVRFYWNLNFLSRFLKYQISNFVTICPLGAKLYNAAMTKLIVNNFADAPNWDWDYNKPWMMKQVCQGLSCLWTLLSVLLVKRRTYTFQSIWIFIHLWNIQQYLWNDD